MRYSGFAFDRRTVSKLGFGAMGFAGWFGPQDEGEAVRALHYALDSGVTFIARASRPIRPRLGGRDRERQRGTRSLE
jgi:aryl-alcohol dehydrogenase-like predicted oxidoreductase